MPKQQNLYQTNTISPYQIKSFQNNCKLHQKYKQHYNKMSNIKRMFISFKILVLVLITSSLFHLIKAQCVDQVVFSNKNGISCKICRNQINQFYCKYKQGINNQNALNYNDCKNKCCIFVIGKSIFANQCYMYNNQPSESASIGLIVAILVITICVILICVQAITACIGYSNSLTEAAQPPPQTAVVINLEQIDTQNQNPKNKIKKYLINSKQPCSICLEEKTTLMTKCGHYFHPTCLGTWFDYNTKCPLCMTESFNPVILYCSKCNYRVLGLMMGKNHRHNGEEMQKQFKIIFCDSCKPDNYDEVQ